MVLHNARRPSTPCMSSLILLSSSPAMLREQQRTFTSTLRPGQYPTNKRAQTLFQPGRRSRSRALSAIVKGLIDRVEDNPLPCCMRLSLDAMWQIRDAWTAGTGMKKISCRRDSPPCPPCKACPGVRSQVWHCNVCPPYCRVASHDVAPGSRPSRANRWSLSLDTGLPRGHATRRLERRWLSFKHLLPDLHGLGTPHSTATPPVWRSASLRSVARRPATREVAACGARRPSTGYCPARYQRVGPNVPTNSSGRHGPRPDGDAGDEASQFEFDMPATVPLGPGRIILRGVLRPSHAAFGRGHTQQTVLCLACICRCSQHNQA